MNLLYNWNIAGHQKRLQELEHDLQSQNVAHAYLFAGPEEIGKFTIAKNLAHILQCENNFCHTCSTCQQIEKGIHGDTIEVADTGESLKIEQIREILNRLQMTTQSRSKVLLVQNIERMTPEAANALLKTLEDPPPQVIFLLTTSNFKALLATIVSRVRLYKFDQLGEMELKTFLQKFYPQSAAEEIETAIALSFGKVGKAFLFLQNSELLAHYKKMYNDVGAFLEKTDRPAQFTYVGEIANDDKLMKDFLDVFLARSRAALLKKTAEGSDVETIQKLIALLKAIQQTQDMVKKNVNARLALENLMLQL